MCLGCWQAHAEDVTIEDYKGEGKSVLALVVENSTPENWDGMYRCHAVNYAGQTHQDFKLAVQGNVLSVSTSPSGHVHSPLHSAQ